MRWFRKTQDEIDAEEEATFRENLAKKLENYRPDVNHTATFSATDISPADPFDELHGDGIDADPSWLPSAEPYNVEEIALADLSSDELKVVSRLRQAYLDNLRERKFQEDPDTQRFNAMIAGEEND